MSQEHLDESSNFLGGFTFLAKGLKEVRTKFNRVTGVEKLIARDADIIDR